MKGEQEERQRKKAEALVKALQGVHLGASRERGLGQRPKPGACFSYSHQQNLLSKFLLLLLLSFLIFFRAALAAYGSSQTRGLIGAVAAGLHHSYSNSRFELHLQPTPQLMAMLDPQPTE